MRQDLYSRKTFLGVLVTGANRSATGPPEPKAMNGTHKYTRTYRIGGVRIIQPVIFV